MIYLIQYSKCSESSKKNIIKTFLKANIKQINNNQDKTIKNIIKTLRHYSISLSDR